jgi:hypothetical protein
MISRLTNLFWRIARHPHPYRVTLAQWAWSRRPRPNAYEAYDYCVRGAADLARRLGKPGITVAEFGVAGGNGLVALETFAARHEARTGVKIDVEGFDTGAGLPAPTDYRDLPYKWGAGYFPMDEAKLRARLTRASLWLGDVSTTVPRFASSCRYPLGAVMFDLDYYSSTIAALQVFDVAPTLPRVPAYFDDLVLTTPFTGEWAAIETYNCAHPSSKIARTWEHVHATGWRAQIFEWHCFNHPDYNTHLTSLVTGGMLPLTS